MAVTATHLTTASNGDTQSSYTTASITLTANRLGLLAVASNKSGGGTAATPTVSGWTLVRSVEVDTDIRLTLFRRLAGSDSTGALTIDFGGENQSRCQWSIAEFDGIDTGGVNGANAVVQSADNSATSGTSLTVTLAAFGDVNNATYGAIIRQFAQEAIVVGSGFTELGQSAIGTTRVIQSEWKNSNDTSVDWSWTTAASLVAGIGIEIKASTVSPSSSESASPSASQSPSSSESASPSSSISASPSSSQSPSSSESASPSSSESASLSETPSSSISASPSSSESASPSETPSSSISASPSSSESASPSSSQSPSSSESASLSSSESASPSSSQSPSSSISASPSSSQSASPSASLSASESASPSASVSASPSASPSSSISASPSASPSSSPSASPSSSISASPSSSVSSSISASPSSSRSSSISSSVSASPSCAQYEDLYTSQGTTYTDLYRDC
jgi:hypothetical protein